MQRHSPISTTMIGLLLLLSSPASPWDAIGHSLVGRLAEQHLSAEARHQLEGLRAWGSRPQARGIAAPHAPRRSPAQGRGVADAVIKAVQSTPISAGAPLLIM